MITKEEAEALDLVEMCPYGDGYSEAAQQVAAGLRMREEQVEKMRIGLETFATRVMNFRPLTSPELDLLPTFEVRVKYESGELDTIKTLYPQSVEGEIMGLRAIATPPEPIKTEGV